MMKESFAAKGAQRINDLSDLGEISGNTDLGRGINLLRGLEEHKFFFKDLGGGDYLRISAAVLVRTVMHSYAVYRFLAETGIKIPTIFGAELVEGIETMAKTMAERVPQRIKA